MKKRIFYWQHLNQLFLLSRIYHIQFIPLHLFIVLTLALWKLKHQIEGFTLITFVLIACFFVQVFGQLIQVSFIQYLGSIAGGLVFFAPVRFYWLPQYNKLIGFRHDQVEGKDYFQFYPIREDDQAVRYKALKWCSGIQKQKMIESLNLKNPLVHSLAILGLSFLDKVRIFYGQGLNDQTQANIIFSHGKGATPLMYTSLMRHLAFKNYRIGGVQHKEQSYLWLNDRQQIKQIREKQVYDRALQVHKVIQEQLIADKMILMGHSYGCATVIQAYHLLRPQIKQKISHLLLLDPWLFPLSEQCINKQVNIPILILANEDFVKNQDVYEKNKRFATKHQVEYIIWKGANHQNQTDLGYVLGNFMGKIPNAHETDQRLNQNYDAIDRFLKDQKVESTYGSVELGRNYKPQSFYVPDYKKW